MKKVLINSYLFLLRFFAGLQLLKNRPIVIGITGSAGKSSCTKVVAGVLAHHFAIKYTKKGNSETGIPFEILDIPVDNYSLVRWTMTLVLALKQLIFNWEKYSIFVVEMGIDSNRAPKDMTTLLNIVQPEIGVLLNANNVHLQYFHGEKTTQAVAKEKGKLLFSLPENGLAIYNADQDEFKEFSKRIKANQKLFSTQKSTDIQLTNHSISLSGSTFEFDFLQKHYHLNFPKQLLFKESFGSFAAAILIAERLGIDPALAIQNIEEDFKVLPGRGRLLSGINQSLIIDSSYNSSLDPTTATLKILSQLKNDRHRTIAVLGDMRELGELAQQDHQQLEKQALAHADIIYTVGPLTNEYFKHPRVKKYLDPFTALNDLKSEIKKGDIILFKGSQNTIFLESLVEELLANPSDKNQLCRQTPYWEQQRLKLKQAVQPS